IGLENCTGYAAQTASRLNEFIERVSSPALKIIFDTGNSVSYGLNSLDVYTQVKEHVAYVHLKDAYIDSEGRTHYVQANHGQGYVRQILKDLHANGYQGGVSLEPHVMAIIHSGKEADSAEALYQSYIEYGENVKALVEPILQSA
ncbi:MAG: sugar phosphate isomerase/epimerase, partial [Planctomycetes bacterium]|nr:sugar phosphate isomerase/epimerase [Planctomycetota bacterium]